MVNYASLKDKARDRFALLCFFVAKRQVVFANITLT